MTRSITRTAAGPLIVAALAAALVLGLTRLNGAAAPAPHAHAAVSTTRGVTLRLEMRRLWEEHIAWTRMVIVDVAAGLPDLTVAEGRLLQNQADIGRAVAPYYGAVAGSRLTALLRAHILIAADLLAAAKKGDTAALAAAQHDWSVNGRLIADFLAAANPAWPRSAMRAMMREHLALTTREALARLHGDWSADVRAASGH